MWANKLIKEYLIKVYNLNVKQGFDKYEETIKNYFIDNYDEEIIDGDLLFTDLIYYSKDLKKIKNSK